uniref:Unannotated protein n=1 Tax=freshwater metagenome TaxID=449393 RepID=A0A6J5ZX57_9ZZZZ
MAAVAATTTAPAADAPVDLTIEANGDFLIHSPVWLRAKQLAGGSGYNFAPMLKMIKPYVEGSDLALCHVETPMTPKPPKGYPVFNTPTSLAKAIKSTGYDACDTASNHSLDMGQYGIDQTGYALSRNKVKHTGSFNSAAASRKITMLEAKGVKVAYLAYTAVSNGQAMPHPWSVNWASSKKILGDAKRARAQGAEVVIVNLHAGDEYVHTPSAVQMKLARALTKYSLVTAVIGQHVHVVQPIRKINNKLVVFGEGNTLSNQTPSAGLLAATQDGYLALLRIRVEPDGKSRVRRVDYVPTYVRHPDFTVVPVGRALDRGLQPASEFKASWNRTVGTVGRTSLYAPYRKATP